MLHVVRIVTSGVLDARHIDSVILTSGQRRLQTGHFTGVNGTRIGAMLPEPVLLRNGDALELDDGSLVDVVIEPEPLVEIRGTDLTHLARLAWHLGDRHVPVQIFPNRLRMQPDGALEAMLKTLGARLTQIEAPFDPEGGAYAHHAHAQDHQTRHHHAHGEHHHHHDHDHHHGHHHHD
jgi:urease accessory protein